MRNVSSWVRPVAWAWLLLGASAACRGALAQTRFGLGYVANSPHMLAGGNGYILLPSASGIGVYVDAKFDTGSPTRQSNYLSDVNAQQVENQFGDQYFDSDDSWRSVNVALMKQLKSSLTVYAGAGRARKSKYNEYLDATATRGTFGHYWVEDEAGSTTQLNVLTGVFFRMSRFLNAQFGVETAPAGLTVGLSLALPRQ